MVLDKIRKKIKEEVEDLYEVDEDSDIPISEKKVKEREIKKL